MATPASVWWLPWKAKLSRVLFSELELREGNVVQTFKAVRETTWRMAAAGLARTA
jgi:hypothetical protein